MINIEGADLEDKLNQIDLQEKEEESDLPDKQLSFKNKESNDSVPEIIKSIDSKLFSKILFKDKYIRDDEKGKIEFVRKSIILLFRVLMECLSF